MESSAKSESNKILPINNDEIIKVINLIPGIVKPLPCVLAKDLKADEFYKEFICKQKPLVIKGAALDWPAVQKLKNPNYLESFFGTQEINYFTEFNGLGNQIKIKFDKYVELLRNSSKNAVFQTLIHQWAPDNRLTEDLGPFSFLEAKHDRPTRMYAKKRIFIYKNAGTDFHYHPWDETLTVQLLSKKTFFFIYIVRTQCG